MRNHEQNGSTVFEQLAARFPASEVNWKAQAVSGERALAVSYIDARSVMDRLDAVVGPGNWRDDYHVLSSGNVVCTLSLRLDDVWVGKSDVGARSEQHGDGDQEKAAFSDSLKRAAVKWGVGRYLYQLPKVWCAYDPSKRRLIETPVLSDPPESKNDPKTRQPVTTNSNGSHADGNGKTPVGRELFRWLKDQEKALLAGGLCNAGELVEYIAQRGEAAGHSTRIVSWSAEVADLARQRAEQFIQERKGD